MKGDTTVRVTWQVPPHYADAPGAVEHLQEKANRDFAGALLDWLKENGGGVVGPIHVREETRPDWLYNSGDYRYITMFCKGTALPELPECRLMGGPADGLMVRTGGARHWVVPLTAPMPVVEAWGEDPTPVRLRVAEYERIGETTGYRFVRVSER